MTQPPTPFRVGLIGYGLAGQLFHGPFIASTPGLVLAAIVTTHPERQALARQQHPGAQVLTDADDLWVLSEPLDLIVVAAPNIAHVPLARAAIQAGIAVVVDKPLAASSAEARKLVDEARRQDVLLTVYQSRRFDGDFATLRRLVGDEALGQPLRFESRFERWRTEPKPGWREKGAPEEAGGLLFDLGAHLIDQAVVLFGPPTHVYAEVDRRRSGVEVDDDVFVALTHDVGIRSHLWMSAMAANRGPRFRMLGSKGAYVKFGMDVQEDALKAGQRPPTPGWGQEPASAFGHIEDGHASTAVPTLPGHYGHFYEQMVPALMGERLPPVAPEEAVRVLEIIEAAHRSARDARVIRLVPAD